MAELIAETRPVAGKPHICEECRHTIPKGVRYLRQFCRDGGDTWTWIAHEDCAAAAFHLFEQDGGVVLDGWRAMARESKRHKHQVIRKWSRLLPRNNTAGRPNVPDSVLAEALMYFRASLDLHPSEPEAAAQQQETNP